MNFRVTTGRKWQLMAAAFVVTVVAWGTAGCKPKDSDGSVVLLNVSYDPTRELWKDINKSFVAKFQDEHKKSLQVKQSHGGSSTQARSVIDGLEADVVTLAMWTDTAAISKQGLIADDWLDKFPNHSLPYTSTIVFVVRDGNPKNIKDWPDLVKGDVSVITPSPKTSGNGKLSFLAAWGSVIEAGGTEEDAKAYVKELYRRVPVLDTGARGATTSFAHRGLGDVHLTWENEAHLEVKEAGGKLQIIYPSSSILAEPHVAIVDRVVDKKKSREAAEEYLNFLYTPACQEIIAKHYYRPSDAKILEANRAVFPEMKLFRVSAVAADWEQAQQKYFAEGGVFDSIYLAPK